jgi:glucose-6-phosphate isomerase
VFLQITADYDEAHDLAIPDRPFTFGQFIQAQAAGDASVLADRGRPVLTLTLRDVAAGAAAIAAAIG